MSTVPAGSNSRTVVDRFREKLGHQFMEAGNSSDELPVVCLHGILGTAAEWLSTVEYIAASGYRVLVPAIPFDTLPSRKVSIKGVTEYVRSFIQSLNLAPTLLVGNSLGGQIALRYVLDYPESVAGLVLAGSAGLYEVPLGKSLIRRGDREFLRESAAMTFYDPAFANDALVDRLYKTANNRSLALRILRLAKDSQRQAMQQQLGEVRVPTFLIWGREDRITPPDVAETFVRHIPNAELHYIQKCGHAPMIEAPEKFSRFSVEFFRKVTANGVTHAT